MKARRPKRFENKDEENSLQLDKQLVNKISTLDYCLAKTKKILYENKEKKTICEM